MRISLLLRRESFPDEFVATLTSYLSDVYGKPYRVTWRPCGWGKRLLRLFPRVKREGMQYWHCNPYINSIFMRGCSRATFRPVILEYSRGTAVARRLLQSMYVVLAVNRWTAPLFSMADITITPAIPGGQQLLILGGNCKLRILDSSNQRSYVILKSQAASDLLVKEALARDAAEKFNVPMPRLINVKENGAWLVEEYIAGRPLNRLASARLRMQSYESVATHLCGFSRSTATTLSTRTYSESLAIEIKRAWPAGRDSAEHQGLSMFVDDVCQHAHECYPAVVTAVVHGDFQPANIIVSDKGAFLIDWEFTGRRQLCYDQLTWMLGVRARHGLAVALKNYVDGGIRLLDAVAPRSRNERQSSAYLLILEELALVLAGPHRGLICDKDRREAAIEIIYTAAQWDRRLFASASNLSS